MLRRGWRVLGAAALGGLLVGGIVAMLVVPSTWESEALVVADVEPNPADPWASQNALSEGAELMMHPSTLAAVRARVGADGTVEALARRVEAEEDRQAGVIRVTARDGSREGAAALANAMVDSFLDVRRESERARLAERARLRRLELTAAEQQLADARSEYDAFRQEHGITDLSAQQEAAITEAARLSAEADEESVAAISSAARMDVLRREARRLPAMTTSSASSTDLVQSELAEARAELARARARYTQDHPTVQGLEARVATLEQERRRGGRALRTDATTSTNPIRDELEGNVAIAAADRATSAQREEGLRRLAEQARERVRELTELEGQASLLLAAVRIGEQQVEALRRDIAQAEDRLGDPPPGFHVTARAALADSPLPSKNRLLAWVLPPMLSLLVAFGLVFFRERGGPRTQTAAEVAWWGHAPVIGTTTWPREPEALDLLVAELEDLGTYAAGRTLVVPATPNEKDLATEFAAKLAEAPWLAAGVLDVDESPRSEPPRALLPDDVRVPGHRPTLPMPMIVTPAPVDAASASGESDPSTRVRRATVQLMMDNPTGSEPSTELPVLPEAPRSRKISGRFTLSAPTVLVGQDVRVGNIVRVGEEPVRTAAAVWTRPPAEASAEQRTIHVSGTVDDGRGAPQPFEVRAEAPAKQDAVLMLAMRILGDVDPEAGRATMLDARPPKHRALDATESRAPHEQAVALAWTGAMEGPTLRRAARLADRVIVLVREGTLSPADLAKLQVRLGREDAIGFLVVGADEESAKGPDRVGAVAEFWTTRKRLPG
ncbi:Tyrosine-protein kinase Wzc [Sandaracinus amylolyticus]|uniref:Tyrosine-protein kinase Wzc n=2 Tax=Sandaracinus amylolyticus TaxID=927083 RepID=A0A0F6W3Q6_9BACT|nr:Tyrosine-protein kinase Wzc [Sandaracinus amylolyticus]